MKFSNRLFRPFPLLLSCFLIAAIGLSAGGLCPAPAAAAVSPAPLAAPPLGERWFGISMNGEKVGFAYMRVGPHPSGYQIDSEESVKMKGLGFSREASGRAHYVVNRDLSLRSFAVEQTIDGTSIHLQGEAAAKGVSVVVETKGSRKERLLKAKGPVFPPPVLNIYPLMHGSGAEKTYRVPVLDIEAVKISKVEVTVVGVEEKAGVRTVHMQNDLYPVVSNDIWVDTAGNTVLESVRDGLIETKAEPQQVAMKFLVEAALSKKDMVLDFSRIPVSQPIKRPQDLAMLKVELSDFPEKVPLVSGETQLAERVGGGRVLITIPGPGPVAGGLTNAEKEQSLSASERIRPDNERIVALKEQVLKGEKDPAAAVDILTRWVASNIKEAVTDSVSPLETLEKGSGNCQSHARLYASLARAAGIPTRFVSGLVYLPDQGFLYHSWAESYTRGWIPVDPTFGQVPADATHIKFAEGDSPGEMALLVALIGRIKAKVVEKQYRESVRPG